MKFAVEVKSHKAQASKNKPRYLVAFPITYEKAKSHAKKWVVVGTPKKGTLRKPIRFARVRISGLKALVAANTIKSTHKYHSNKELMENLKEGARLVAVSDAASKLRESYG